MSEWEDTPSEARRQFRKAVEGTLPGQQPEEMGVLEKGMSVATLVDGEVVVVHFDVLDRLGTFRVRRGPDIRAAYAADEETVAMDGADDPLEWAVLPETGLEIKMLSAPGGWLARPAGLPEGPLRLGVRPRITRERG